MPCLVRSLIICLTAGAVAVAGLSPAPAQDQAAVIAACRDLDDAAVHAKIKTLTEEALTRELAAVDYGALVDKHWRSLRMSERIDREVDDAVAVVSRDVTWIERAYSTVSRETAEKFASAVAERAYGSEGFKAALAELAQAVAGDLGARIEQASDAIASPILACVQSALQSRYGGAVAEVFARETEQTLRVTPEAGGARIGSGDLALERAGAISGIVLIVTRQVVARVVTRIGQRVAGLVAGRIVATFTGLVGLALIAKDLYEAGAGVFPIVAERMKSQEAKDLIRGEITKSIEGDIRQHMTVLAEETAERIYAFWLDFKQKYSQLLRLAERNAQFAAFLRERTVAQLGRLGRLIDIIVGQEGEDAVFARTADGSLRRALLDLGDPGVTIATDSQSLDTALKWQTLAGARIEQVVALDLHKLMPPDALNRELLGKLLAVDDRGAITRLAKLDRPARDALLSLPTDQVRDLARRLDEPELDAFALYQHRLQRNAAHRLLRAVAEDPLVMRSLAREEIRDAILGSRDQRAAIDMLLRSNAALNLSRIGEDIAEVRAGDVHYRVFVERYWPGLLVALVFTVLLLLWLRRLIFGHKTTIVVKASNDQGGK